MAFTAYWIFPIVSAVVWLAMLLALLVSWVVDGSPRYFSMQPGQNIAYISDVGAQRLKPLFIAMSAVTVVTFDIAFIAERWLRHTGALARNTSLAQKILSILATITAIAGAAGLILLAVFDTLRHPRMHNGFLVLFMAGYILSAIFSCAEYQRLGIHFREHRILRISFWIKLFFILCEVALAIAFGVCQNQDKWNVAAVLEWIIALIFTFYVASFFADFLPAGRNQSHKPGETQLEMAEEQHLQDTHAGGRYYGAPNGHANGYTNGYTNGPTRPVGTSSNF